jgi:hypothetical protein
VIRSTRSAVQVKEFTLSTHVVSESLVSTLPGTGYVDEDVFRAEQERIPEQSWSCAVRAADRDKPGAFHDRITDRVGDVVAAPGH